MSTDTLHTVTAVIGDLVGSRMAADREALHTEVMAALGVANERCRPAEALRPTVGDEFQGVFWNVADALDATLLVRACLTPPHDVRFGVAVGRVEWRSRGGGGFALQDGPAWWAAREAIGYVTGAVRSRQAPPSLRTWLDPSTPEADALDAYLLARDHLVSAMDARDRGILRDLLLGQRAADIAAREGISPSAVYQRARRSGATAIVAGREALRRGFSP